MYAFSGKVKLNYHLEAIHTGQTNRKTAATILFCRNFSGSIKSNGKNQHITKDADDDGS